MAQKYLRTSLPPNASRGQKALNGILRSLLPHMTILAEYPLERFSDDETAEEFNVRGMAVDFYITELNWAIEFQGTQHYQDNGFYTGQMGRDVRKKAYLEAVGVRLYEIIDTGKLPTEGQVRRTLNL